MPSRRPRPLGSAVRAHRIRLGLTQQEVAELADVAPETVSRVERNRMATSLEMTGKLATALGVSVDALLSPRDADQPPQDLRPAERRLIAAVRGLDDAQVDDIARALRILLAVRRRR